MDSIKSLILRAKDGDEKSRAEVFERYADRLHVVARITAKGTKWEAGDLAGHGACGLHEAINTWDPDHTAGCNFSGWADKLMKQKMWRAIRDDNCRKRQLPRERLITLDGQQRHSEQHHSDEHFENEVENKVPAPTEGIVSRELSHGLYKALCRVLPKKDWELVCLRYGFGIEHPMSARKIAQMWGMKPRTVNYRIARSLRLLRKELEK